MSVCRVCNAPITWAQDLEGHTVPLDAHELRDYGPDRYRILTDGTRPVVALVTENSAGRLWVDHRTLCQQPRAI